MKKTIHFAILILAALVLCLAACSKTEENVNLWADAIYTEDAVLGEGSKTVEVEVEVKDKAVTFTINTDAKTVGEALSEHDLISGEKGAYGLYVKKVNGITADYDINKSYWAFTKNGESMLTGVDGAEFSSGEHYELVYTDEN